MVDFSKLRNKNSLKDIQAKIDAISSSSSYEDARYWQPEVDKAGNGFAIIRFLPAPGEEPVPFVRLWQHSFKGPTGQWYIENSLSTLGLDDPVSEYNSILWNSTQDDNSDERKQARAQKRKLYYISNVLIVDDQAHPENNGTVRLYKYGKKIFDKIKEATNPQFADETPIDPFSMWEGANFKIKIRNVEGYRNYDKSEFEKVSAIGDGDEFREEIWKKEYSLEAEVAEDKFKSYDALKARLNKVLNKDVVQPIKEISHKETPISAGKELHQKEASFDDDGDDDGLEFFQKLAGN